MYTVSVFLAILAFVLAFIPKFGAILALISGLMSAIMMLLGKAKDERQKREVTAINSVLLIVALIVAAVINYYYYFVSSDEDENTDYTYYDYVENATTYNVGDEITLDEGKIVVNSITNTENKFMVEVSAIASSQSLISGYDFCIIDADNSQIYYPKYTDNMSFSNSDNNTLEFEINSDYSQSGLFLYYNVKESCFKIKI